jgi:hypothetical protein
MAKYDGLRDLLHRQTAPEISLSFKDVAAAIGSPLPESAARPQWWANVVDLKTSHVQRNAWRDAGYDAFLVSGSDRVIFRRARR